MDALEAPSVARPPAMIVPRPARCSLGRKLWKAGWSGPSTREPRAVGWEQVDGHAPHFPDQPGPSALGDQPDLVHSLLRLAGPRIGITHRQEQALRRLARLHLPSALSREGDAHTELAPLRKLAF